MTQEWTLEKIRNFTKAGHQSVSARMVKCMVDHYDKDISEFAEWCNGNSWLYANYSKLWTNIGGVQKTTSQLREQWEIETGRR